MTAPRLEMKMQPVFQPNLINPDEFKGLKWVARYHLSLFKRSLEGRDDRKEIKELIEVMAQDHKANSTQIKLNLNQLKAITQKHSSKVSESKAAHLDVGDMLHLLGLCYLFGVGFSESMKQAFKNFKIAAGMGHALAMGNLGEIYCKRVKILQSYPAELEDRKKGINWVTQAAALGNSHAQYLLGSSFHYGLTHNTPGSRFNRPRTVDVVAIDKNKSVPLFESSAVQGNPFGLYDFGFCCVFSSKCREDRNFGFNLVVRAKEQELAVAQYMLGFAFEKGYFTFKSNKEAFSLYKKSMRDEKYLLMGCFFFSSPERKEALKRSGKLMKASNSIEKQVMTFFRKDLKTNFSTDAFSVISDYVDWDFESEKKEEKRLVI